LVREVGYASAFTFKYSPRPGTPGAEMEGHLSETVKDERLQRLQALINDQQQNFIASVVGRTVSTLIEKPGRRPGQILGRSPWLNPVIVDDKAGGIGDIIDVRITKTGPNSLFAELA
ncbi:MAG: TRAM domain-containing protein, partial [Mesorhizobium sp.]